MRYGRSCCAFPDVRNSIKRVKSDVLRQLSSPKVQKVGASRGSRSFDCLCHNTMDFLSKSC